jgi:hypothetical protein
MEIKVSLAVAVIAAIVYVVSPNAKASELARIAFFVGLMWLIYGLSSHTLHV